MADSQAVEVSVTETNANQIETENAKQVEENNSQISASIEVEKTTEENVEKVANEEKEMTNEETELLEDATDVVIDADLDNQPETESQFLEDDSKEQEKLQVEEQEKDEEAQNNSHVQEISVENMEVSHEEKPVDDNVEEKNEEEEEEEEDEEEEKDREMDLNLMPQINVANLAKRKWQVKVYPLKPSDFVSGQISKVFKNAQESLLYVVSPGKFSRGKGEMYVSSVNQTVQVVLNLLKMDFFYREINLEIIKKTDDSVVEEKAYIRFDSNMIKLLCVPSTFPVRRGGKKRERVIGSVFVKNLPLTTSKDMLRVMFPFAQEINFNPEKFHNDGTARIVVRSRDSVNTCLKSFVKVELGGNILELHPVEKKKRNADEEKSEEPSSKHRKVETTNEDQKEPSGDAKAKKEETPSSESKSSEKKTEKRDSHKSSTRSPRPKESPPQRSRPNISRLRGRDRVNVGNRVARNQNQRNQRNRVQRGPDSRRRGGQGSARPRMERPFSPSSTVGSSNRMNEVSDVMRAAGAAKDMVLLQNQLSVAIKNQLSMLNQTQLAVHQARQDAVNVASMRDRSFRDMPSSSSLLMRQEDDYIARPQSQPKRKRGRKQMSDNVGESMLGSQRFGQFGNSGLGSQRSPGSSRSANTIRSLMDSSSRSGGRNNRGGNRGRGGKAAVSSLMGADEFNSGSYSSKKFYRKRGRGGSSNRSNNADNDYYVPHDLDNEFGVDNFTSHHRRSGGNSNFSDYEYRY